jgi:hypothetical protein
MTRPKSRQLAALEDEASQAAFSVITSIARRRSEPELLDGPILEESLALACVAANGSFTVQRKPGGIVWHVHVSLNREDSVWLGTGNAFSEDSADPELKGLRYGATPEIAVRAVLCTLREATIAFERQRNK